MKYINGFKCVPTPNFLYVTHLEIEIFEFLNYETLNFGIEKL